MSARKQVRSKPSPASFTAVTAPVAMPAGPRASFAAALAACRDRRSEAVSLWKRVVALWPPQARAQSLRPAQTMLMRLWSWLQTRSTLTATRRLRVTETVALGEKRFVALVSVEGREFLIGGGASGVSLLAHLSGAAQAGTLPRQEAGLEGIIH
jgi:Flagellar biosynthesis protein, FliO